MTNAHDIPWKRISAEGVAIVISILLAFGIQAWWESRQNQAEEVEILAGLEQEFKENVDVLEVRSQRVQTALAEVGELLVATQRGFWIETDGPIDDGLIALLAASTIDLGQSVRDSLVSSGRLELLENKRLRNALADWDGVLDEVHDDEMFAREWVYEHMYPYLVQSGVSLSRSYGDDIGTWPVPTESAAEREDATARLWSDPVFEALLQTRYWTLALQTSKYQEAISAAKDILEEIEISRRSKKLD